MNVPDLVTSVHGIVGVLALAAMIHPAIFLRDGRPLSRGLRLSLGLTALVTALAFGMGVAIYEDYRAIVKRPLFVRDPAAGLLFETKEHLAFAALALVLGAAACALLAPRARRDLRQLAAVGFAAATAITLTVAALGLYVSSIASFASVTSRSAGASLPEVQSHGAQVAQAGQATSGQAGASATASSSPQPSSPR
ncbi:MAG: hypothetical protein KF729_09100 [Sandaracinaceae bacterium]|nr:hypothetical protein [Sandaracinaceae bacterium]